ncbi:Olfactory receptor 14C36 [Sciurus carolinensis]|uniref:Olfactory receptor 14C36 n=1 Tax=Sciurus carolinensis TaxID=30640 RepID=A0AA41T7F7_SCICA|nr:Olfactory receptor 14C36 [Sciurus carolinensis]
MVTEFHLLGSSSGKKQNFLYFMVFQLTILGTFLGNLLTVTVTSAGQNLHTPMYFFLRNLSILDMCFISITVPNACINSLTCNKATSLAVYETQIFSVNFCACVELPFLSSVAWDHYVNIYQALQYPIITNSQLCVHMTLASILSGLVYAGVHTGNTFQLFFPQSNVVLQLFCDVPSLLRLSCSHTTRNKVLNLLSAVGVCGDGIIFIAMSYIGIFSTVLKFPSRASKKAFSTCTPHILVLSIFLRSATGVYLRPSATSDTLQDMLLSPFYTMVPPFLNPLIYSLRNKQIKEAVRRVIGRQLFSGKRKR